MEKIRMPNKEQFEPGDHFVDAKGKLRDKMQENENLIAYKNQNEFVAKTEELLSIVEDRLREVEGFLDSEDDFFENEKSSRDAIENEIHSLHEAKEKLEDLQGQVLDEKSQLMKYKESFVKEYNEEATNKLRRIADALGKVIQLEERFGEEKTRIIMGVSKDNWKKPQS